MLPVGHRWRQGEGEGQTTSHLSHSYASSPLQAPVHLPRFTLGGEAVLCVAWNSIFHVAGVNKCGSA